MSDAGVGPRFDENGWSLDALTAIERDRCWSLFSADAGLRLDHHILSHKAHDLLALEIAIEPVKSFSKGGAPLADRGILHIGGAALGVRLLPIERAAGVLAQANEVARAMGGAGMDVLLKRARKLVQIESAQRDRATLSAAAVLSAAFLAVVLPPDEDALFGIKGARERLSDLPP